MYDRERFHRSQSNAEQAGAALLVFVVLAGGWCGLQQQLSNSLKGHKVKPSEPIYWRYEDDTERFRVYFEERFGIIHYEITGHPENYKSVRNWPIEDRHLVVLATVYPAIENGSFRKWIYLCGYLHEDFVEALIAIGAPQGAAVFDELRTFFPENVVPADEDARYDFYQRVTHEETEDDVADCFRLEQVENTFHDTCENIYSLAIEYHKTAKQARLGE